MVTAKPITHSVMPNIPGGMNLLGIPTLNTGTAFTEEERTELGLHGLLPLQIESGAARLNSMLNEAESPAATSRIGFRQNAS